MSHYRFDVSCHYCGRSVGCRRYGFQWVCVDCEEEEFPTGNLLPYEEQDSDRPLYNRQTGGRFPDRSFTKRLLAYNPTTHKVQWRDEN